MALTTVQIANLALSNVGAKASIESLTEASTEAKAVNLWYDHSRITTLEAYDWSFARTRKALALDSEDPPDGVWAFRYQYPTDCVTIREVEHPGSALSALGSNIRGDTLEIARPDAVPFETELSSDGARRTILTNTEDARIIYTKDIDNVQLWSRHFVTAFSYRLAHDIAFQLTGKLSLKQQMFELFVFTVNRAAAHDANERVGVKPRDADWIRGRE